jgi:hypothetical protein
VARLVPEMRSDPPLGLDRTQSPGQDASASPMRIEAAESPSIHSPRQLQQVRGKFKTDQVATGEQCVAVRLLVDVMAGHAPSQPRSDDPPDWVVRPPVRCNFGLSAQLPR